MEKFDASLINMAFIRLCHVSAAITSKLLQVPLYKESLKRVVPLIPGNQYLYDLSYYKSYLEHMILRFQFRLKSLVDRGIA